MTTEIKVERGLFDEVMVPCYNPMEMIPVKGEGSRVWEHPFAGSGHLWATENSRERR